MGFPLNKPIKPEKRSIIFLHIPKAAGTTLNRILDRQYKGCPAFSIEGFKIQESVAEFKNLSIEKRSQLVLLKGHMHFGLHAYLPRPSVYLTILRNPVDRLVSHYDYVLRNPSHYLYDTVVSSRMSLKDYVESGISPELDNGQVRLLSGHDRIDDIGICPEELLKVAQDNLLNFFSVFGFAERFDETLMMMKKELSWRGYPFYRRENVGEKQQSSSHIPDRIVEKIKELNALDCRLYEWAMERFEERIESRYSYIRLHLSVFSLLNTLFQKYGDMKLLQPVKALMR